MTRVVGKGTVLMAIDDKVLRIGPVYYIPDLNTRLLSLGQFLQSGLHSWGSARTISLHKGDDDFIAFYPRSKTNTIYVVKSLLGAKVDSMVETIYTIDFETMHRQLVHPSNDVLRKAGKYTKDFPNIQIPTEHICPGCAQGKISNKTFPSSGLRATEPFELIHSDLKLFPIDSYQKFKYAIIFYDDCTSYAWTINLRTKDAALPATRHFLAMVETQYKCSIQGWMSDAGGEYTSKVFINMLTE
jgi:hypothetical protein